MKKKICFVLIITMLFTSFNPAYALDFEMTMETFHGENEDAFSFIEYIEDSTDTEADYPVPENCISGITQPMINAELPQNTNRIRSGSFNENLFTMFNTITAPSIANGAKEPKFGYDSFIEENVSDFSGELTLNFEDLVLDGLNDFDLRIGRTYQSVAADNGEYSLMVYPYYDGDEIILNSSLVQKHSSYLMNRYNLGAGWSFSFPSVEIATEYVPEEVGNTYYYKEKKELYYHTGSGAVYRVEFTEDTTDSNLEGYYKKDICFEVDSTYTSGQISSSYSMILADKSRQYFADDGRLLAMADRFGNEITFEYTMMSVSNRVPDGHFDYNMVDVGNGNYVNVNSWLPSTSTDGTADVEFTGEIGKSDYTSAHFIKNNDVLNSFIMTKPIQVEPNRDYRLDLSIMASETSGNINIEIIKYDTAYNPRNSSETIVISDYNREEWYDFSADIDTTTATRYIVLRISSDEVGGVFRSNSDFNGIYIDNVYFDYQVPVISKITDTVGRTVDFEYNGDIFNTYDGSGDVVLTVSSPDKSETKTLVYNRSLKMLPGIYLGRHECRAQWYLSSSVTDGNMEIPVYYTYGGGDENGYLPILRRSHEGKETASYDPQSYKPVLTAVQYKDRAKIYEYETVTKNLGTDGYYDTLRIKRKYDMPMYLAQINGKYKYVYSGCINEVNYSYYGICNGDTINNETGFPLYNIDHSVNNTVMWGSIKNGKYYEKVRFNNNSLVRRVVQDGDLTVDTEYENHTEFHIPTLAVTTVFDGESEKTLYKVLSYNNLGDLESESIAVDYDIYRDEELLNKYTTTYEYESVYRLPTKKKYYNSPDGNLICEENQYNANGTLKSFTDASGKETKYSYENTSTPWLVTRSVTEDPMGFYGVLGNSREIEYTYDSYNLYPQIVREEFNGGVSVRRYSYDYITGALLKETLPDSSCYIYSYYPDGKLHTATKPCSVSGLAEYYNLIDVYTYRDLVAVEGFGENLPVYTEEEIFHCMRYEDADDEQPSVYSVEYNYYDAAGNLKIHSEYVNNTYSADTMYYHDAYDRLIKVTDSYGQNEEYTYDNFDRPLTITDKEGNKYIYSYNDISDITDIYFDGHSESENRHMLRQKYDDYGNIIQRSVYPENGVILTEDYDYDIRGNMTGYTDPKGNIYQYEYDKKGRMTEAILPNGQKITTRYSYFDKPTFEKMYDSEGNELISRVSYRNEKGDLNMKLYQYNKVVEQGDAYITDPKGRTSVADEGENTITYIYDELDNPLDISSGNQTIQYLYTPFGKKQAASYIGNEPVEYEEYRYNVLGDIIRKVQSGNFSTSYSYSADHRLMSSTMPSGRTETYSYSPNDNLTAIATVNKTFSYEYYDTGFVKAINYPNGLKTSYEYDNINRVRSVVTTLGETVVNTFAYTYDENSNVLTETRNGSTTSYTYDCLDRLVSVTYSDNSSVAYEYDGFNNRTKETYSDGNIREFVYNNQYQLAEIKLNGAVTDSYAYNESGALVTHNNKTYSYDAFDRMTEYSDGTNTHTYRYNTNGIRTAKDGKQYVVDVNNNVIAEADSENVITEETVWGHQPLARKTNGSWYYYIYNAHGDVVGLVNDSGTVVNTYEYTPWGEIRSESETVDNPIKYAGEYYDDELDMIYLRARYYNPQTGRFISRDILEGDILSPLDMNRYVYCRNNPLKHIDPSGLSPEERLGEGIWSFKHDKFGVSILSHWLFGGGTEYVQENGIWGSYMKDNSFLKMKVQEIVLPIANDVKNNSSKNVDIKTSMEIQNGEDIIGYQYLHGTNADVGGFQINGTVSKNINGDITYDLTYTWNDKIDPNFMYYSDSKKAEFAKSIPLANPTDYIIRITWSDKTVIKNKPTWYSWNTGWLK